ncbi:hypothetical protein GGS26DRAFT_292040 [Hypomontagnella submonticulosa]|nr:hypothetical protein GGS26DRAFT_292040 [Hypomontagnella submonticulosa]
MASTPKAAQSPAASPAKGKAAAAKKPSSKGVSKRTGRKPVAKKGGNRGKGRGQKKAYNDPLTQAAYERQRELRDLYSQVALAVKPALDEIADQSLKKLIEDNFAYKEVPEYLMVKQLLDGHLERALQTADQEYETRVQIAKDKLESRCDCAKKTFEDSFNYLTEEIYDGAENRANILDELRREGHPTDTPDLTYTYVKEIPYVSFLGPSAGSEAALLQNRKTKSATKRKAGDQPDGETNSKKPRHTGVLLASEMQPDGVPESNAPSPTPVDDQDLAPVPGKDLPDLPNGATDPDEFGVRSVSRRGKDPRNRYIVPPLFQFDEGEIGFRDSTNDSTRKATRSTRGMFLDTPNCNTWHWDHTVKEYDCREYKDDTLDPEIVKKHGLHPRYGMFLPTSTNDAEPPTERVDGTRPVVVVPDQTTTHHASRSVRPMKMDLMLKEDGTKGTMAAMLSSFCAKEDISPEDIVSDEMRDRERQILERLAATPDDDETPSEESDHPQLTELNDTAFMDSVGLLLQAAEEANKPMLSSPSKRQSRPYDAVRDVFTGAEPAPPQHSEGVTNALSIFADIAGEVSRQEAREVQAREVQAREVAMGDSSMIDPRLLGPPSQLPQMPNTFLQTALNPASPYAHIAPAPAPAPAMEVVQHPTSTRIPFANQGSARDSPVLPPLRPNRPDGMGKASNVPQTQPSLPPPAHRPQEFSSPHGLVLSNTGSFYMSTPSRPYHQGISFHEPLLVNHGQPMAASSLLPNQPPMPAHIPGYHPAMSPPLYPHLGPMTAPMEVPVPSTSPPAPPTMAPSPPAQTPRGRGSGSSNGSGSGKYRKIAAAPIPHNRSWHSNGGTELRLAHYDFREAIKDYSADEPPPRSGPTTIRGWNVNNVSKGRNKSIKKEDSDEKDSPK